MAEQCPDKEAGAKYGTGFGKRPDVIIYDADILAFAQRKATSFHVSEESWSDPLQLQPGMRRAELDSLRTGWDLIIDVDFPLWEASQQITERIVEALLKKGVASDAITVKYSGNKGFHVGIPFEAFPDTYDNGEGETIVSDLFPEAPRRIIEYLLFEMDNPSNGFRLSEKLVNDFELPGDVFVPVCEECGRKAPSEAVAEGNDFVCSHCDYNDRSESSYLICAKCNNFMERIDHEEEKRCECGSKRFRKKVNLGVDALLVSNRHMYRLVYSLHEKSGLASIPINKEEILSFDKRRAEPDNVLVKIPFLNRDVPRGCATDLFNKAMKYKPLVEEKKDFTEIEWSGDAAPEELFPPPIRKMLAGLEDGRKRALFVLTNFLRCVGWSYDMIEARLDKWNEDNAEPLREQELKGHLRYHKQRNMRVLPPNFDNEMYYKDLGVLEHDELSRKIKNPVQYVRLKAKRKKK